MNKTETAAKINVPADLETVAPAEIKGLTIREIRYRRALVALQKEFCREKMTSESLKLRHASPFSKHYKGSSKPLGRATGLLGKVIGGMNYVDYAILGFTIFSNIRKVLSLFKRHK